MASLDSRVRRKTILLVEDHQDVREGFREILKWSGYQVREAGDGIEALRLIESEPPDVIVLDLSLPMLDGMSLRQDVAANSLTRDIPVIVVTGSAVADALRSSVDAVLRKPVSPEWLLAAIRDALHRSGSRPAQPNP